MKNEEHMGRIIPGRVVAAAVALFLAGLSWHHCGGLSLRAVMIWLELHIRISRPCIFLTV